MPASLRLLFMVLVSCTTTTVWASVPSWEATGARRIVLQAGSSARAQEVFIGWGKTTTLLFDTSLRVESTVLEEDELFRWGHVGKSDDMLTLLPVGSVQQGMRLKLTVYFADGVAPASADFLLVVVEPARAETMVEVYRPPRACAPYWHKAEEERAKVLQCELELAQVRTAWRMVPVDLTDLLESGRMGEQGILAKQLTFGRAFTQRAEDVLRVQHVTTYRAMNRVAAVMWLANWSDQQGTVAEDAVLVGEGGARLKVVRVWSPGPILPGVERHQVVVEAEATSEEARRTFTLEFGEQGGLGRSVRLEGVTFP